MLTMAGNIILILLVGGFAFLWLTDFWKLLCGKGRELSYQTSRIGKKKAPILFGMALFFRILVFLCGFFLFCMLSEGTKFSFSDYLSYWNRWDGPHYLDIAQKGYFNCIENGQHLFLVFFPLYPLLTWIAAFWCGDYLVAAILVSFIAFALGAALFYMTLSEEYGEEIAKISLVLLSTSPFAFFFGAVMTESLFFCLLSASFFFIKRHKWLPAALVGILCSLCRAQGVIILGVYALEFLEQYPPIPYFREKKGGEFGKALVTKAVYMLLIPIGTIIYLWINYRVEGNCFQFVIYQKEHWHLGPTLFINTIREISSYLFSPRTTMTHKIGMWLPEFFLFFLAFAAMYYGRKRHSIKYTAFLFVYTMINFSVTWLVSGARYMLCALPLYVIAGEFISRHKKAYPWLIAVNSMLMMVYLMGFFLWKSVM